MLHLIAIATALLVIVTGLYVLAMGEWQPFKLKYSAVVLSTTAALWVLVSMVALDQSWSCEGSICLTYDLYHIARNTAFVLFHVAVGRDTIRFKNKDRRSACLATKK